MEEILHDYKNNFHSFCPAEKHENPNQIFEIVMWFTEPFEVTVLRVVRISN